MSSLRIRPNGDRGKVHDITPQSAGWGYVGFGLHRLAAGEAAAEPTGDTEAILVLVEGKAKITAGGTDFGELGDRMDVFERKPPHCVYVPNGSDWSATARSPTPTPRPRRSRPSYQQDPWHYSIARMVDACTSVGALPFYGPYGDISDEEGCETQFRASFLLGCVGAWSLHPVRSRSPSASTRPTPRRSPSPRR